MSTRAKATVAGVIVAFVVGIVLGNLSDPPPETKWKVLHDTKTVTKTETKVETVQGEAPEECADLAKYARTVLKAANQFDMTAPDMLDIMSRLRKAIVMQSPNAANDLETELRQVDNKTIEAIQTLGQTKQPLVDAASACEGK